MRLIYRPIETWPGPRTERRQSNPFDSSWTSTLDLLDRELRALNVDEAVLQVDSSTERDFRLDGQLRAGARLRSPAVILAFEAPGIGPLSYPCDTFDRNGYRDHGQEGWQINVRAIALGLEALRKVERYGIAGRGQQYTGWKQIGRGTPMLAGGKGMTRTEAARFLAEMAVVRVDDGFPERPWGPAHKGYHVLIVDPAEADRAYKIAAKRLHPDTPVTGSHDLFVKAQTARDVLAADPGT